MFSKYNMKSCLFLLSLLAGFHCFGQSSNADNIKLNINKPLIFTFNSIEELLEGKTINNAMEIKLKVKEKMYNVSANVLFSGQPQGEKISGHLALRLRSKTSMNAIVNSQISPLSLTPVLLFTQPSIGISTNHYSYTYDLLLSPFTSFVRADTYNFTLTFTLSEP